MEKPNNDAGNAGEYFAQPAEETGKTRTTSATPRPRVAPVKAPGTPQVALPEVDIYSDEAVSISQPPIGLEGETDKRTKWRQSYWLRKKAKNAAKDTSAVLVSLLDGLASMAFGPQAAMNDFERQFIQEPLERILMRMDVASAEIVNRWSDPIMLAMGLIIWGSRISRLQSERHSGPEDDGNSPPDDHPESPKPDNGRVQEVLISEQLRPPIDISSQIEGSKIE